MGQSHPKEQPIEQPTPQIIQKNIDLLFNQHKACQKLQIINQPIIVITRDLALKGSFQKTTDGLKVNHTLLKCMYHPNFQITMKNLVTLLSKQLKSILETKVVAMISRQKFRKCLNATNFCIFFTDQSLIQSINLLSIRSDLQAQSKQKVLEFTKEFPEINQSLLDTFGQEKLLQLCRIFRLVITLMIDLHLKLLTRSDFTLKIIDKLNQSLFVMYIKAMLQNQDKQISRRQLNQNPKVLLRIGAYFVGLGLQNKCASIYELGVCLLQRLLLMKGSELGGQKALPSHLFKSLPVVNNNQMMYWLANNILFALKYIKNGTNYYSRMNFNRIPSLKLLTSIFEKYKPHSSQITYLFEQICLQTKTFQIQRVYVCAMADLYSKLQNSTDIIKKYSQTGQINFNLKAKAKQIKIKPEDVRTQLESDEQSSRKEIVALCGKYTIQVIFQKTQVYFEYSDKSLWNMILNHMEEEGAINDQSEPVELNKEGEQQKI